MDQSLIEIISPHKIKVKPPKLKAVSKPPKERVGFTPPKVF